MRIECPDCAAAYEVPDHLLARRKTVRCSRCGIEWDARSGASVDEKPPGPQPLQIDQAGGVEAAEPPPVETPAQPPRPAKPMGLGRPSVLAMQRLVQAAEPPPRRSIWPGVVWVISLVALAVLVWAAFNWRADIMQVWPPSRRVFALLGLVQTTR